MCSGRVDLAFVLRAFSNGADGVFIGGCWPGECHYVTEGNYDALFNMHLARKLLQYIGINPQRLRLEWMSASEGTRYAEVMNDFGKELKGLGALGSSEGFDDKTLDAKFEAVSKLVPYIKLVERERMRVRFKTEEEYNAYFAGDDFNMLFEDLVAEKLAVSQIVQLLREQPLTTVEITDALGLKPAQVSKHLKDSSRHGLVRYDEGLKRYALV
jgi:F420-non-reducing hydrogenase iron-sulfur subunit